MTEKTETTDLPYEFLERMEKFKREKLLDIIRRVTANPGNAEDAANAIALDWFPKFQVKPDGKIDLVRP